MMIDSNQNVAIGTITPAYKLNVAGDINASGAVRSNGIALTSDVRLKQNITNTQHGLSTVMTLRPVEYEKKNSIKDNEYNRHEIGFIAQEVAKVLPSLVTEGKDADKIDLASLKTPIYEEEEINNPNAVKVITDKDNFALYFSRSPIPYPRDKQSGAIYYKHKGIYAFRKAALMDFYKLPMLSLEASEKIECLRYLEYGKNIKMVETSVKGIGIDTPQDLEEARKMFQS